MKYIEYIYLSAAIVLLAFLAQGFREFETFQIIAVVVGIGITSFMYSFRRKQRMISERIEREEIAKQEKELEEPENG